MSTVNIYEAKTQLSRLVDRAAAGEEIVIARAGKPLVRLVPVETKQPRPLGLLSQVKLPPDDFFDPLSEEELALWEGTGDAE
jgi:prevent-host-death family protein